MKRLHFFTALLLLTTGLAAQTIRGTIEDAQTGESIIGATIVLKEQPAKGVVSGLDGSFVMSNVAVFPVTVTISFVGYIAQDIIVRNVNPVNVKLEEDRFTLSEVVVIGEHT